MPQLVFRVSLVGAQDAVGFRQTNPDHLRALSQGRVIFVKRKTGFLTYDQDPKGLRSVLSRSFPKGARLSFLPQVSVC
jgi:hypothetical protein